MLYSAKLYLHDRFILVPFVISFVLLLVTWGFTISRIHPVVEQLFLHYNVVFGIDLIGEWWRLYFAPLLGTAFLIVSLGLGWFIYGHHRMLVRILVAFLILVEAGILVGQFLMVGLNT